MYIRSEILFYSDAQAELYNVISEHMSDVNLYIPK